METSGAERRKAKDTLPREQPACRRGKDCGDDVMLKRLLLAEEFTGVA